MPKHLDDATFLARLAAFARRSPPAEALALARLGDERALPALITAMTDTMEGEDISRYREAVRAGYRFYSYGDACLEQRSDTA